MTTEAQPVAEQPPVAVPAPLCLLEHDGITYADVLVYGVVLALGGRPSPGMAAIAAMLRTDRETVRRCMWRLRQAGLVRREWRPGGRSRARFIPLGPGCQAAKSSLTRDACGCHAEARIQEAER